MKGYVRFKSIARHSSLLMDSNKCLRVVNTYILPLDRRGQRSYTQSRLMPQDH